MQFSNRTMLNKISDSDVPVLLIGESGTGKSLFAVTVEKAIS